MHSLNKSLIVLSFLAFLFLFVAPIYAAAPDGNGPWADSVVSSSQGVMKNSLAVPAARSDNTATLGVAENDTVDSHFFSLGFGGNIILSFDNGISSGVLIVESTNPNYPFEKAKIEISENNVTWLTAGTVTQDGTVSVPDAITCAKYVRITDISDAAIFPDDIADGYDVDGVMATGDVCTLAPSPTPSPTPASTATPTPGPTSTPTDNPTTDTSTTSTVPGFPNTGGSCTATTITTIPSILEARRINATSIFLRWGPDAGLDDFVVRYGFVNGDWKFSTNVSGFSTTIGELPPNQAVWVQVAATDGCATGSFGTAVLVGGTPTTNTPGFPNTGLIPRFPNTGIDPTNHVLVLGAQVTAILSPIILFLGWIIFHRRYHSK